MGRQISWGEYKKSPLDKVIEKLRILKVAKHIKSNVKLLDLGCGYEATFLNLISNKIKEGVGMDISVNKDKTSGKISLIKGRVDKNIKLPSNHFDVITSLALIEHVQYPNKMLKEAYRLLRKKGVLMLTTPSQRSQHLLEAPSISLRDRPTSSGVPRV